jgi:hypothetical protein
MKRLIIHGDAGVRKDATIEYDGAEKTLFQVTRNGDWHGPDEVQLWCIMGDEDERGDYERRNYVPHWLDTETIDAEDVTVTKKGGPLTI